MPVAHQGRIVILVDLSELAGYLYLAPADRAQQADNAVSPANPKGIAMSCKEPMFIDWVNKFPSFWDTESNVGRLEPFCDCSLCHGRYEPIRISHSVAFELWACSIAPVVPRRANDMDFIEMLAECRQRRHQIIYRPQNNGV